MISWLKSIFLRRRLPGSESRHFEEIRRQSSAEALLNPAAALVERFEAARVTYAGLDALLLSPRLR